MKVINEKNFTKEEMKEYEYNSDKFDEPFARKLLMQDKYLSELSSAEVRKLFIERLINSCNYVVKKEKEVKYNPKSVDYLDFDYLKRLIKEESIRINAYEEIVLAMTSTEFESIEDILIELAYEKNIYIEFKEIAKSN